MDKEQPRQVFLQVQASLGKFWSLTHLLQSIYPVLEMSWRGMVVTEILFVVNPQYRLGGVNSVNGKRCTSRSALCKVA